MTRARAFLRVPVSSLARLVRGGEDQTRARTRAHTRARRRAIAGSAALAVVLGTVSFVAARSPGYPTQRVEPNDGGVWVTNDRTGLYGRLSTPSAALDVAFSPYNTDIQGHQLDIVQSGSTVVARDRATYRLTPVDVRTGELVKDRSVLLADKTLVAVGGDTVATLDPQSGAVRAASADADQPASVEGLAKDAKPVVTVGLDPGVPGTQRGAALTVADDGTVLAVGSTGELLTLRPTSTGAFSRDTSSLGSGFQDLQVAAVGDAPLVVDTVGLTMVLPNGRQLELPPDASGGVLQAGRVGPTSALLATPTRLLSIDLESGTVSTLFSGGTGPPPAPIAVGGCRYAVWAGSPGVAVRGCGHAAPTPVSLENETTLLTPQLRVNRRSAVLNDGTTGRVWDIDTGQRLDDWASVAPPPEPTQQADPTTPTTLTRSQRRPRAVADDLGARPGRTSVLHPLDNDSNPAGSVLSIREVTAPQPSTATLSIAPDGQSIQIAMNADSGDVSFTYTIDDAKGSRSSAPVIVHARRPDQNGKPVLRMGFEPQRHTVANQGRLSLPVLGDWRDPDGDPVVLASASDGNRVVPVSADGHLQYTATQDSGPREIAYVVSDGREESDGAQPLMVLPKNSAATTAPTTQPDVARGQTDSPIVIRPLDNDLPGTDPTTPAPRLALAGDVVAPDGTTTTTDLKAGEVTLEAGAPGTYLLTYTASYGNAPYARGTIRVDVTKRVSRTDKPTAMLDQAVVYGTNPTVVDVLANDFDPSGRLLAVQSAEVIETTDLEVAVIRGRWLRIRPNRPTISPNPQRIRYTITDGVTGTVTGEVAVQQLALPKDRTPDPVDDYATVRSGDTVAIPVLDNDIHPAGEPLTLLTQVEGTAHAGMLRVRGPGGAETDVGGAYASGRIVRYQAPTVTKGMTVAVTYVAEDPEGNRAAGTAYITVVPPPTTERPDAAPTPPQVEGRVVAGDTMTIQIPTTQVDPDGDSVTLVGLGSAPTQGRVLATTLSSITYQAYPTSAETDTFSYVVSDRFGKVGTATVRVAVLPPGDPQPPVAVDDYVTAAPGSTLHLDILSNDIQAIGDSVTVQPLAPLNPDLGSRAFVDAETSLLTVEAPSDVVPLSIRYAVRGSSGTDSFATVHVRAREGVDIPPVARNPVAEPGPGASSVTVDVLATATDPDGGDAPLTVTRVFNTPGATISDGRVTVPVGETPQIVAYEIADEQGGVALGSIYVPSVGSGAPLVRPNSVIRVDRDATTTVALGDVVVDPADKPVILTTDDQLSAAPAGDVRVEAIGADQLKVTARRGYVGPAAIAFQVSNGATATDPAGQRALLTIPVQVGPETPVLRCPDTEISVVLGGRSRPLSIPELCHVWTAQPDTLGTLHFAGRFPNGETGLSVANASPSSLVVSAAGIALPGTRAELLVSVPGTQAAPATIRVLVDEAVPPTLSPITVAGVHAGTSRTINISGYIGSLLGNPQKSIVEIRKESGADGTAVKTGPTTIVLTPAETAHGRIVYRITVSDIADTTRQDRLATGYLTVEVLGVPDAPGRPIGTGQVASHEAGLSWAVPANNGLPIDYYDVTWDGGTQRCAATPCTITDLTNGTAYSFIVVAHNGVGDGPPSKPSAPVTPDAVPGEPVDPHTLHPADGTIDVAWSDAPVDGTPVTTYLVTWPGGSAETSGTSVTATGLDNMADTTFTVKASNDAGWGPGATTTGQSAGHPPRPNAPKLTPSEVRGGEEQAVDVDWAAVSPNGPGPTTYTVRRSSTPTGPGTVVCDVGESQCHAPAVPSDGTTYWYTVTAANAYYESQPSDAAALIAAGTPGAFTGLSAAATGASRQVRLQFTSPPAHDAGLTITCKADGAGCGSWDAPADPTAFDELITVPENGTQPTITLTATNSAASSSASVTSDTVYGPLKNLTISELQAQGPYAVFTVSLDPQGLAARVTVDVRAGGETVLRTTDTTGVGLYSRPFEVKVGYTTNVRVTVTATRAATGESLSAGPDLVRTTVGAVSVTCTTDSGCSDGAVTLHVDNLAFSRQLTCSISTGGAEWGGLTFATDALGRADYAVPTSLFVATSGTTYTVKCDDAGTPAAPVTTTWRAP